ncbi:MAG TPA: VIT1/CCC1 transporter family protein [Acidimicrobiales bacterium]
MEQAPGAHQHRDILSGGARAAIFGVSDGLVTNVSLILGVAGAHPVQGVVRLTGLAGLVAGAFSMGAGELVSMQAQRELLQRELDVERHALRTSPEGESRELAAIYERRGIDPGVARDLVEGVMADPELALEVHAREELGVNPQSLGSPWLAAVSSFGAFCVGAVLPLLPWLFASGSVATLSSVVIGGCAALLVGLGLAALTGRSRLRSAVRQLAVAAVAAAVTYGIGRGVGAGIS